MKTILSLCLLLLFATCKKDEYPNYWDIQKLQADNLKKQTISQGIAGTLIMESGNCMPSDEASLKKNCKRYPVSREIRVHEYTMTSETEKKGRFFTKINSKLLKSVFSDELGFYEFELPAGNYSVFVKDSIGFIADISDGKGGVNPIQVDTGVVYRNLKIDYALD